LNRYEGLFILASSASANDDAVKDSIERIEKLIQQSNGKIEAVQKLGQRPFARRLRADTSGYYVNYVFRAPTTAIAELDGKLHLESYVARWQFNKAEPESKRPPRRLREPAAADRSANY
jgi:ribosomal protein S6